MHSGKTQHDFDDCKELQAPDELLSIKFQTTGLLYANKKIIQNFSFEKIFGYIDRRMYVLDHIYGKGTYKLAAGLPEVNPVKIDLTVKNTYRKPQNDSLQGKPAWKGTLTYKLSENISRIYQIVYFG